jgi:hypothetical protein
MGSDNLGAAGLRLERERPIAWVFIEREGMAAFMEKRPPSWIPANLPEA